MVSAWRFAPREAPEASGGGGTYASETKDLELTRRSTCACPDLTILTDLYDLGQEVNRQALEPRPGE